ncbi:XdhC family protein [Flavobacterium sp. F52]|uniref:XdhC family protein n=1 Tax=Flavobacterium sp. F52 TaxID=1202532 RepID=UPI000272DBE9|nr:XdhC/CoxI family protein [Flavobacterium sp. F52]EJG03195.1 hypothetical protein FF52_03345 [Flavobacterium sp. F52]
MMHELLKLREAFLMHNSKGIKAVMATVTSIEGSSYRRPGVRMLVFENNNMSGAVSGGCVEKEILKQSQSVLQEGKAKMMVYDGRYRLGCEGMLYILIEPFLPDESLWEALEEAEVGREHIEIESLYARAVGTRHGMGSVFYIGAESFGFSNAALDNTLSRYRQIMKPRFHLIIIGSEHDAVQLCYFAYQTGWEVTVVASINEGKTLANFPGASHIRHLLPQEIGTLSIDKQTAVILMTHSYVTDLKFLLELKNSHPAYLGLLGPLKRRNQLLNEFFELAESYNEELLDVAYGPCGISIGAETPQEIAVSIIAEILSVMRKEEPVSLKYKKGTIHS